MKAHTIAASAAGRRLLRAGPPKRALESIDWLLCLLAHAVVRPIPRSGAAGSSGW